MRVRFVFLSDGVETDLVEGTRVTFGLEAGVMEITVPRGEGAVPEQVRIVSGNVTHDTSLSIGNDPGLRATLVTLVEITTGLTARLIQAGQWETYMLRKDPVRVQTRLPAGSRLLFDTKRKTLTFMRATPTFNREWAASDNPGFCAHVRTFICALSGLSWREVRITLPIWEAELIYAPDVH